MFDQALLTKLLCVAFVAAVMLPAGGFLFPLCEPGSVGNAVSRDLSGRQRNPGLRDFFSPRLNACPALQIKSRRRTGPGTFCEMATSLLRLRRRRRSRGSWRRKRLR